MKAEIFPQTAARLEEWRANPDVLGVLLVGSKSRGHQDDRSDDDLEVLLSDAAFAAIEPAKCHALLVEGEGATRRIVYDAQLTSLTDLERKPASAADLDHWPYERARVLFARDERVERAVAKAACMESTFRSLRLAHATIDAWAAAHRAKKTIERGFDAAATVLVASAARGLSRVVFALESRWVPLDHWLERELASLEDPAQAGDAIVAALRERRPEPILEAFARLEDRLASEGVARPTGRTALFLELIHPSRAAERAVHGLS